MNHFRAVVISEGSALWEEFLHSGSELYQVQQWFLSDFPPPSQDLYLGLEYEILKVFLRLSMPMSSKLQQASGYVTWHFNTYKSRAAHLKLKLSSGETFSLCYSPRLHFQAMEKGKLFPRLFTLSWVEAPISFHFSPGSFDRELLW